MSDNIIIPGKPLPPIIVATEAAPAVSVSSGNGRAIWGRVYGNIADQADLQAALAAAGGGGGISDGDKGDITVSASGASWTIDANAVDFGKLANGSVGFDKLVDGAVGIIKLADGAVTLPKMASLATSTILGRATAGTGVPEALTAVQVRTLLNVADGATANATDAALRDRSTHTGTQLAATISDFSTAVASTASVTANTAKVTNATHTGDATGATALTLATVNSNVGSFGSATQVSTFTVNAKGLTTAAANVSIAIPATAISDSTAAGRAVVTAATATAQTALFDLFTSSAKGLVPLSGGGTTNFLRADGTWAAPSGGGGSLTVQDEGSTLSTAVTTVNFTGAGVTATGTTTVTVNIPGGGSSAFDYGKTISARQMAYF